MRRSIRTLVLDLAFVGCCLPFLPVAHSATSPTAPAASAAGDNAKDLNHLEFVMRMHPADSAAFGQANGAYWQSIEETQDLPRAYSFFAQLSDESAAPNATLLASKASAACAYLGWINQNHLTEQAGEATLSKIMADSTAEYNQALQIDPENFSALYGYAIFEGYRPGGQAHQKELLAKLDTLRTGKPYLPWALVDQLEKTGKP